MQTDEEVISSSASETPAEAPLVLVADADSSRRARRFARLTASGFRVSTARTLFETVVKASCLLPRLILLDVSLGDDEVSDTAALLASCPATAHIPVVRLTRGGRLPGRLLTELRQATA